METFENKINDLSIKQKDQLNTYQTDLPEGVSIEGVYVGEEGMEKLKEQDKNKVQLPPYPDGIFDWSEDDMKLHVVPKEIIESEKVVQYKLLKLWGVWGGLRTNEKLIEIINKNVSEQVKDSDEFFLKQLIVSLVDMQGKILNGKTNLTEDIFGKKS